MQSRTVGLSSYREHGRTKKFDGLKLPRYRQHLRRIESEAFDRELSLGQQQIDYICSPSNA